MRRLLLCAPLLGISFLCLVAICVGCSHPKSKELREAQAQLPSVIDFNYHVKPILSDKCFACHGPDQANQQADLRLDIADGAFAALSSGNGQAIVPRKLHKSQAFLRMISDDPALVMPPPEAHLALSIQEVATIAKWIEQGAAYKPHWSLIPLKPVESPATAEPSLNNEIDRFIVDRLRNKGLSLAKEAAPTQLIRRLSFTLTGLPPSLAEIEAFLDDPSPDAYERLVDRYLASDAYGEHMAAYWMDVARYADSDGYLDDKHRENFPYRDWVIQAFNDNMSYEQFVTWQIAGDLLPDASRESILATAFNRMHKKNSEAGIVYEEFRVEYVADRTNTFGKAFLGLTMECARCHDHKYDPISQQDYYQLFSFFNSTNELGTPVYGPDQTPGPSLMLPTPLQEQQLDSLKAYISKLDRERAHYQPDLAFQDWKAHNLLNLPRVQKRLQQKLVAHYGFDQVEKKGKGYESPEAEGRTAPAKLIDPVLKAGKVGQAFFTNDYNKGHLGKKVGWYDRTDAFSLDLWVYPDTLYEDVAILYHSEDVRIGLKGYTLSLQGNKPTFIMAHSWPQNAIQVQANTALPIRRWTKLTVTYDGSSQAKGVRMFLDGQQQSLTTVHDNLYKGILFEPNIHTYGFRGLSIGNMGKSVPFKRGGIDELKVYEGVLSALEVWVDYVPFSSGNKSNLPQDLLQDYYAVNIDPVEKEYRAQLSTLRQAENQVVNEVSEIMVMGDLPQARPTFVLNRGAYDDPGQEVFPKMPKSILSYPDSLPPNRLGLAQWLFDKRNPLTARVFVNRIWHLHFGRGLTRTIEDVGNQGGLPSHPELLDWLAWDFMQHGWDIKRLHKQIVLSTTFRQSSKVSPELHELDPENIYLARGPSRRMTGEMIRDNALAISGLLNPSLGGPSVHPYQPKNLWASLTNKKWAYRYPEADTLNSYRRSLYTFWKHSAPPPSMQIFDLGSRAECVIRRQITSTPLQALNLLNDPQFIEAARMLAEQALTKSNDPEAQIHYVFMTCTGRAPTQSELNSLKSFYQQEKAQFEAHPEKALAYLSTGISPWNKELEPDSLAALGVLANSVMNTDEAYTLR